MNPLSILGPVGALAGWTLLISALIPLTRFRAAFAKQVTADDFKVGESARVPEAVRVPNRVYINLFEAPVLFYVVCLILYVTHAVDLWFVAMAWVYVALRLGHSLIYLTYNRVIHRLTLFGLSGLLLGAIWIRATVLLALSY